MARSKFTIGRSTFDCSVCGRLTRLSSQSTDDAHMCGPCEELAALQNAVWDDCQAPGDVAHRDKIFAKLKKTKANLDAVKSAFADLFALT